jgi:hypothetical protein
MSALECHPLLKESLLTLYSESDSHLAWLYVEKRFDTPDTNSEVWRLEEEWLRISISGDIGNNTKTVHTLGLLLSMVDVRLPPRSRYSNCESAERILYLIMKSSGHLSQAVALKLNAPTERRICMLPPTAPGLIWTRDLHCVIMYYGALWEAAMQDGFTVTVRAFR